MGAIFRRDFACAINGKHIIYADELGFMPAARIRAGSTDEAESKALYAHASQPSGVKWVEALRASVRPIITYAFFILFATVKTAALFKLLDQGVGITDGLIAVWDAETQALFAAVMSFWFGQRALAKFRSNP